MHVEKCNQLSCHTQMMSLSHHVVCGYSKQKVLFAKITLQMIHSVKLVIQLLQPPCNFALTHDVDIN